MSSKRLRHRALLTIILLACLAALLPAGPAWAVKVCCYNILNWPEDYQTRAPYFATVMAEIDADVIVLQEVESQTGVNRFRTDVLDAFAPGEYWQMPFANGPDTDNACFYKTAVVESIFWEQIYTPVRYTSVYRFRPIGYQSSESEFTILSTHLKAGSSSSDAAERLAMTTVIREYLNGYPSGSNFMVAGDFNLQSSSESSYQMLIGYQADNDGRSMDPIASSGYWHDNSAFRFIHTQSTQSEWGGMDDRFDFILVSFALDDGEGLDYVFGTYDAFGNDGAHLNLPINDPPNGVVSQEVADALNAASDHLPVVLELQLPAKIDAPTALEFGQVIVGATAEQTLSVSNVATPPAENLIYTLSAPAGFTAPGEIFTAEAGYGLDHTISMNTGSVGTKSGDLLIDSNDLDAPSWDVALSGTVLNHASPSLDAGGVVLEDTLDFGASAPGTHANQVLSVYNDGYDSLQALLEVYDATIVGGDGRFTFEGGFTTETAGADPADYAIAFDSGTATWETPYTATLTLSTRDEQGIAGGTNLDDLTVHLRAYVESGASIPEDEIVALALSPGAPNPFTDRTELRLALPQAADVDLKVYDVTGRIVRTLAAGQLPAGEHRVFWDGRDDVGAEAASGIYFCGATVGDWREVRKLILMR
jgi:endonuclease/exonuclease/phosphatase family metal-dependent hydrolase